MNKVSPQQSQESIVYKRDRTSPKKRIKNIGKWLLVIAGFPLAYIILPVSCCIRNPAVNAFDEKETPASLSSFATPGEKMGENIAIGIVGVIATVSCCCCFGMCGSKSPSEML